MPTHDIFIICVTVFACVFTICCAFENHGGNSKGDGNK
jgi:hypothetical protein